MSSKSKSRKIIKTIIDEADPFGLLSMGAPQDEYDDIVDAVFIASPSISSAAIAHLKKWLESHYGINMREDVSWMKRVITIAHL